jgi:dolichyl-phosphate beta-glucosyltransferase
MTCKRSFIIPCYNERERLPPTLESVCRYIDRSGVSSEIVVVDDGSSDDTAAWARSRAKDDRRVRVVAYSPNKGKGHAVKEGIMAASGESLLFLDADGSTPVVASDAVWPLLETQSFDVVIGSRQTEGSEIKSHQAPARELAGKSFGLLTRLLVIRGVKDTQCGFKAFKREPARRIFSQLSSSSAIFDIELLVLAVRQGLRIGEVAVEWTHDDDSRLTYDVRKTIAIFAELVRFKLKYRIWLPLYVATPCD